MHSNGNAGFAISKIFSIFLSATLVIKVSKRICGAEMLVA